MCGGKSIAVWWRLMTIRRWLEGGFRSMPRQMERQAPVFSSVMGARSPVATTQKHKSWDTKDNHRYSSTTPVHNQHPSCSTLPCNGRPLYGSSWWWETQKQKKWGTRRENQLFGETHMSLCVPNTMRDRDTFAFRRNRQKWRATCFWK